MKIYTIGFTKKTAEVFFNILKTNNVKTLVDVRLNNRSQLSGFTKEKDLEYFLKELCNIKYIHEPKLSPTKEILKNYKNKDINWNEYKVQFNNLLNQRKVSGDVLYELSYNNPICLLCSELSADKCHRRLVAEYIRSNTKENNIEIIHL